MWSKESLISDAMPIVDIGMVFGKFVFLYYIQYGEGKYFSGILFVIATQQRGR